MQPPDHFMMKPGLPVTIKFGKPMFIQDHGDPNDPRTIRVFADAVMFEIAQLSGQRYINTYAGDYDLEAEKGKVPASSGPGAKPIDLPPSRSPARDPLGISA